MNKIVVLNQKSDMDKDDVLDYIKNIKDKLRTDLEIVICPSMIYLPFYSGKYSFKLGSGNLSAKEITGEVTAKQLKSFGVRYSIIGHWERKKELHEDDNLINQKIKAALSNNIIPIICVGETKEEYLRKKTGDVIVKQLKEYLKAIDYSYDIIIAYEPSWLIGQINILNPKELEEIVLMIKNLILKTYDITPKVIYGGSINENNIEEINKIKSLDGFILGKSSTNWAKTLKILDLVK